MQIILETDETWSVMTLVVSQLLDQVELSDEAKTSLKRWRADRDVNTAELADLTVTLNESLGTALDEKTTKLIRRKGRYVSTGGTQQ